MTGGTNRYTGRVDFSYLRALETRQKGLHKGDDTYRLETSTNAARRRLSARALTQLRQRLTDRDLSVLNTLRQLRLATTTQLQRLHFDTHASTDTGRRVTRRVLKRLYDKGLVVKLDRRIGGIKAGSAGHIYALSPTGHRLLGETTRKRFHEPSAHHVRHTLAIADIYVAIIAGSTKHTFDETTIETEPACWRATTLVGSDTHISPRLKPDLYMRLAAQDVELSWFVEVDCNTESSTVLARKLIAYDQYWRTGIEQRQRGVFPKTLWIAPDKHRADFISQVITCTPGIEPALFAATTTQHAIEALTNFTDEPRETEP